MTVLQEVSNNAGKSLRAVGKLCINGDPNRDDACTLKRPSRLAIAAEGTLRKFVTKFLGKPTCRILKARLASFKNCSKNESMIACGCFITGYSRAVKKYTCRYNSIKINFMRNKKIIRVTENFQSSEHVTKCYYFHSIQTNL